MKKRVLAILMVLTLAVGTMAGCSGKTEPTTAAPATQGGQNETTGTATEPATAGAEITGKTEFANDKLSSLDLGVLQAYEESAKNATGIDVTVVSSPDVSAYKTSIQQSIHEASAPGMFTWWSGYQLQTLVENGLVADLTDVWEKYIIPAGVSEGIADAFTFDGKIYAAPYNVPYSVIIYNKAVFDAAGVDKEPETFDEFLDACEKIKASGATPIMLKNDSWAGFIWFQALIASYEPQLYQDICDGTAKYTDERVVTVMNIWQEMLDKGYFTKPIPIADMEKQLANGEVAMMLEPNREVKSLVDNYGMVSGENLGAFVLPSMSGAKKVVFFEAVPICVAEHSADRDSAIKALEGWYSKDHQNFIYENIGPAFVSTVDVDDPVYKETLDYSKDDGIIFMYRFYENTPEDIRNVVVDELMRFELGNGTVEEVLNTMEAKAEEYWSSVK